MKIKKYVFRVSNESWDRKKTCKKVDNKMKINNNKNLVAGKMKNVTKIGFSELEYLLTVMSFSLRFFFQLFYEKIYYTNDDANV